MISTPRWIRHGTNSKGMPTLYLIWVVLSLSACLSLKSREWIIIFFPSKLTTVSSEKIFFFSLHPPPKIEVQSDCIHNQYVSNSCVHFFLLNYHSQNVAWHITQKFCTDDVTCISLTKWIFRYKLLLEENGRWDGNINFLSTWLLVPSIPLYLQVELVLVGSLELIAIAGGFLQLLPTSPVHKPVFLL